MPMLGPEKDRTILKSAPLCFQLESVAPI